MEANSIYQSALSNTKLPETKAFQLKEGQIVHGKINKIFPNSMAEVQIGSNKVIAQLQTSLNVDDRQWFIVQTTNDQLHLKVVPNSASDASLSEEAILRQLQVAPTKTNIELVQMLNKNNLPVSKEIIHLASEWIKSTNSASVGIEATKILLQKNLPFTKEAFLAVVSLMEDSSTTLQMSQMKDLLLANPKLTTQQNELLQLLNKLASTEGEKMGQLLVHKLINEVAANTMKSEQALTILKNLNIIPSTFSKSETVQTLGQLGNNQAVFQLLQNIKGNILAANYEQLTENLTKLHNVMANHTSKDNFSLPIQNLIEQSKMNMPMNFIAKQFDSINQPIQQMLLQTSPFNQEQSNFLFGNNRSETIHQLMQMLSGQFPDEMNLTKEQKIVILQLVRDLQIDKLELQNSGQLKNYLVDILKSLGLDHEKNIAQMLKQGDSNSTNINNLKALLLAVSNDSTGTMKELADKLVSRLTGFQLVSSENNSLLQLNYQIPIPFWDQTKDLTIQWTGKKNSKGEIDPNHCRVLFYLELEHIGMTTVDVQVQNRVFHITIVNETDKLKVAAKPFMDSLKEGLEKLDYKLSHLTFTKSLKEDLAQKTVNQPFSVIVQPNEFTGVDLRI